MHEAVRLATVCYAHMTTMGGGVKGGPSPDLPINHGLLAGLTQEAYCRVRELRLCLRPSWMQARLLQVLC